MKYKEAKFLYKKNTYNIYLILNENPKEYDKITKNEMIDYIINYYSNYQNIIDICTVKELEILKDLIIRKEDSKEFFPYSDSLDRLIDKGLISRLNNYIYEDILDYVNTALKKVNLTKKKIEDSPKLGIVALTRIFGGLNIPSIKSLISEIYEIKEEEVEELINSKLVKVNTYMSKMENYDIDVLEYLDYMNIIDDINELRKEYGINQTRIYTKTELEDIFYYGYINKGKFKKLTEYIENYKYGELIKYHLMESTCLLEKKEFDYCDIDEDLIEYCISNMPVPCFNGSTFVEYFKYKENEKKAKKLFESENQDDSSKLDSKEVKLFYKLYLRIIDYTNNKYKIYPKLNKIYDKLELDPIAVYDINTEFIKNEKTIMKELINNNPYNLNDDELKSLKSMKFLQSEHFAIIKYDKDYAEFMLDDALYMVKGLNSTIEEVIDKDGLPTFVDTTLVELNGKLTYNGIINAYPLSFGYGFIQAIYNDYDKKDRYYIL